jgi:tetratricopeptide (TPR) repeat protein
MFNLLISLGAALLAAMAFYLPGVLTGGWASVVGGLAFAGAYFFLARRTMQQLEAIFMAAQREFSAANQGGTLNQAKVETGLTKIREGFALSKWQLFVEGQVHAQLGMILFMLDRQDEARPHLEKSLSRVAQARMMLAVLHYKARDGEKMIRAFEEAVTVEKKASLIWSTYAWCLEKSGLKTKALEVLARAVKENPNDEKLQENQKALQNNERLRMKAYGQEWWALRLEPVPMDFAPPGMRPQPGFRKGYRQPPKQRQ